MTTPTRKGSAEKTGIPHTRLEEEGLIWAQYYEQGRKLGQGAFGKVHLGTHKSTGAQWAIKTVNKEKVYFWSTSPSLHSEELTWCIIEGYFCHFSIENVFWDSVEAFGQGTFNCYPQLTCFMQRTKMQIYTVQIHIAHSHCLTSANVVHCPCPLPRVQQLFL